MARSLCSRYYRKVHIGLLAGLALSALLYINGFLGNYEQDVDEIIVRKVNKIITREPSIGPRQTNDTIKLTLYEPNPRYRITEFDRSEPVCSGGACELNREHQAVEVMPVQHSQCIPISKCVTVNIKTRHRYREVKAFIDSIHQYYPALKVVVSDEFNPEYEKTDWARIVADSELITYIQASPGVGFGRKLAALVSETPYVLVADDDYIFSAKTNLTKLVDILENSDADIASGTTDDNFPFAGVIRVSTEEGRDLLSLYPGIFHNVIPNYRNCYQADIVKTFFLAKKNSILEGGSWDVNRPFYEHEDFFFQMRKSRAKIVYCDDVIVKHVARTRDLANKRAKFFNDMKSKLLQKWQLDDYFSCLVPLTYREQETCPLKQRKHFK